MTRKIIPTVLLLLLFVLNTVCAEEKINKVRLTWDISARAVYYQVVILKSERDAPDNIEVFFNKVFNNGIEIDFSHNENAKNFYYKVCPLNYVGEPVEKFSKPRPITDGEINTDSPKPTALLRDDEDAPLYPVYSWIPMLNMTNYEVEVYRRREKDTLIHLLRSPTNCVYEKEGFTYPDNYVWRVRAIDNAGRPKSEWSEKVSFTVKGNVKIAALGDSITHGGGAISVPPSSPVYRYEAYADIEIKNLGKSGDKTSDMLRRFEKDVLPFHPKLLIIMGGVNDIRLSIDPYETINNLAAIRDKCIANNITPLFATTTPINPDLTWRSLSKNNLPYDYQNHLRTINNWILKQKYSVDVTSSLCGENLYLYPGLTTDGIHPDHVAKERIAKKLSEYIKKNFPSLFG
ncbi:MAG: SGNH/GDSL hydrolase family protein [Selenomonadaceae bacterium]|nr:SGNH/GDSL hydrolase family protein [Selenomonadaceae bacterium]